MYSLMAVIGWVLHILQAMTGLILWSIMHMIPDRTFVGSQMQGYLTVIALFFRPMLSLMGFYLAFMLSDPIITFTTDEFFTIMGNSIHIKWIHCLIITIFLLDGLGDLVLHDPFTNHLFDIFIADYTG